MLERDVSQREGLFLVIERDNVKGLQHWSEELERRAIPAVIQVGEYTIDKFGELIKGLSDKGFEIGGSYKERPFWNESYEFQYKEMSLIKEKVESCIDKPMRVFNSKYFAYDEVTLQVADELGVNYLLVRGTTGAKALAYKPEEYNTKIISVSNVPSKEMGTGSLCDESLWCRGTIPDDFRKLLFNLNEEKIILVAQTHLSGVKLHWWNVYQDFLDANIVTWKSLEEFATNPIVLPNARIPINLEVQYVTPKPNIPLEQEADYPFGEPKGNK